MLRNAKIQGPAICTTAIRSGIPRASALAMAFGPVTQLPLRYVAKRFWLGVLWQRFHVWRLSAKGALLCWLLGRHDLVRRSWVRTLDNEVGEYHVGCARCTLFWTEDASYHQTSKPCRYWEPFLNRGQ